MTTPTKAVVTTAGVHVVRRPGEWDRELAIIIRDSLARDLTGKELLVYSKICQATGLDPFKRQIYAWKSQGRLIIHVGIGGWRAIAARTGEYAGQTPPQWCGPDGQWRDVWLEDGPPSAARVGVYRAGNPNPVYAIATWREFERTQARSAAKGPKPWDEMPAHMLEIAAERHALQKACPEAYEAALGIMQEAGARVEVVGEEDIPDPVIAAPAEVVDAETGEIVSGIEESAVPLAADEGGGDDAPGAVAMGDSTPVAAPSPPLSDDATLQRSVELVFALMTERRVRPVEVARAMKRAYSEESIRAWLQETGLPPEALIEAAVEARPRT